MEILALHPGAFGDIILSLPALRLLKEHFAGCRLTLAANVDYLAVVPATCSDRSLSLSALPLQRLYGSLPLPDSDLRLWKSYDKILSWTGHADSWFASNLKAIHRDALVATWRPGPGESRHVARIFIDSVSSWIRPPVDLSPVEIRPADPEVDFASRWLSVHGCPAGVRMIAVQAGGGSASKRWPVGCFLETARQLLQNRAARLLVVEGPAETGLGGTLAMALPASSVVIASCLPLDRLAAILSLCQAYLGNDSGISHLAAALGLPCVVIFGPTAPDQWAPLGPRVTVLRDATGCRACAERQSEGHTCLENIRPRDVLRVLQWV